MKLILFSLFLPYREKLKTFPGDTGVHITWGSWDAIQKSPLKNLSAQKRRERGNRQDLFLKTNLHEFKSWQNSEEVEQSRFGKGWLNEYAIPLDSSPSCREAKSPASWVNLSQWSQASEFLFLNLFFNLLFCLLNTCLSSFCNNQLAHLQMVCFKHLQVADETRNNKAHTHM